MRKKQQVLGGGRASLPGGGVLLIWLVMLISLGMAAGGCGPVTEEPTVAEVEQTTALPPEPVIVRFDPDVIVSLEYEGEAVPVSWQGADYLVVPLTPRASCDPQDNCFRIAMDFKVVEVLDEGEETRLVTEFDPPLEIEVPYTADDAEQVKGWSNLTLYYWGGDSWVPFTESANGFYLEGDDEGGTGTVTISEWGDRPIAWGGPD